MTEGQRGALNHIAAIGFDLFDTLVTIQNGTLLEAMGKLLGSLRESGFDVQADPFRIAYREGAMRFLEAARLSGRETHNRFWITEALQRLGHDVTPDDPRIAKGVDDYFSTFYPNCHLVPGTQEMLGTLKGRYPLGLLSNLTHGPAGREIVDRMGLTPYFDVILISGELGFRKPHPMVFDQLVEALGAERNRTVFVGDDPHADVNGANLAGLQPVWTTYSRDNSVRFVSPLSPTDGGSPDARVPRISAWPDLLELLGRNECKHIK